MSLLKDTAFRVPAPAVGTLSNPVLHRDSPDPFVTFDRQTGYYYVLYTEGVRLRVYRAARLSDLENAEGLTVFEAKPEENGIYGDIWAPEMHRIGDRWYIYTSGRTVPRTDDRMWVGGYRLFAMESKTADPFDGFSFAGILDPDERAIDPTVFRAPDGELYMCHVIHRAPGGLFIRKMLSPTRLSDRVANIAVPRDPEDRGTNEGAFCVERDGRLFLVYSASGCFYDDYRLEVMELIGDDPMDIRSWQKDGGVLLGSGADTFGPGHASFFSSPDGSETWVAYHAMHPEKHGGNRPCPRYLHVARVFFDGTGYPHVHRPLPLGAPFAPPSGETEI